MVFKRVSLGNEPGFRGIVRSDGVWLGGRGDNGRELRLDLIWVHAGPANRSIGDLRVSGAVGGRVSFGMSWIFNESGKLSSKVECERKADFFVVWLTGLSG